MMKSILKSILMLMVGGWAVLPTTAQDLNSLPNRNFQEQGLWFQIDDVQNAELSPNGQYLAVRTSTHFLLYDIRPELDTPALIINEEGFSSWYDNEALAFSADSRWVAAIFWINKATKTVRVWDIVTQEVVAEATGDYYEVNDLAFSPTDPILLIARHWGLARWMGQISVLDVEQGEVVREITDPNGYIHLLSISPDGEWVLINETNGTSDRTMTINLRNPTFHFLMTGCPCSISPNWDYIRLTSHFDDIYINTLPLGEQNAITQSLEKFGGFTWNHDGSLVAKSNERGQVQILDVQNETQWTIDGNYESERETMLLFHPFENVLAIARPEKPIELWDVDTGTLLIELSDYTRTVYEWAFSVDGRFLAVVTSRIYVWNLDTGELIFNAPTNPLRDLAFNGDGTVLVALPHWFENAPTILQVWRLPEE